MTAVRLSGLERRFGERVALRGLDLELQEGATLAVFGANGAGKSTLLRILATLLRPHGGTAEVLGSAIPRDGWAVRGRIGFLGHEPLLYRELTVRENLRFHARLHGVGLDRIDERIERVGLARRAEDPVATLSRGMTQRAAIARATLHDPALLLLDEPFANLDPAGAEAIAPLLAPAGSTRILISHDLDAALAQADHVLVLRDGAASLSGPAGGLTAADVRSAL